MNIFRRASALFGRLPRWAHIAIGAALVVIIGILDYSTGIKLNFSIFYYIPVALVAVYGGILWGSAIAILSGIAWMLADYLGGEVHSSMFIFIWNDLVRMGFYLVVAVVIAKLKISFDELQRLSMRDSLTGLLNFRAFNDAARKEIERSSRNGQMLSVAFIDVDNFKSINDRFGHAVGDEALKAGARVLKENLRDIDIIGRVGGDEFAVIFPGTDEQGASAVFSRIQQIFEKAGEKFEWATTFSAGIVAYHNPPDSVDDMIKKADALMYGAKRKGKNCVLLGSSE